MNSLLRKIPKKVKIGGVWYAVKIVRDWQDSDGADGETFCTKERGNTIMIRADLTDEAKMITLIHEALHNMNSTMNHEFLDSLAEQFYQFLTDNKFV